MTWPPIRSLLLALLDALAYVQRGASFTAT